MNSTVIKLYYGREDRLGGLVREQDRCQWQKEEEDAKRIDTALDELVDMVTDLASATDDYTESLLDKTPEYKNDRKVYRKELIAKWALLQAAASKFALVLRIDGNEAYQRHINSLENGKPADMRDL